MKRSSAYALIAAITMSLIACSSTPKVQPRADYSIRKMLIATDANPAIGLSGGGPSASDVVLDIMFGALSGSRTGGFVAGAARGGNSANANRDERVARQSADLRQALVPSLLRPSTEISAQIAKELEQRGYVVEMVPQEFMGPADDPLSIDYEKLAPLADAVITLHLRDSTLHEYRMSSGHEPRLNIAVDFLLLRTDQRIFEADYYYGNDASKNKKRHFPSSRECIFPKIDASGTFGSSLAKCFRDGSALMAHSAAEDVLALLNQAP